MGRLVSIVLVTWNSRAFLARCLQGIQHQTHRSMELIAVDNASSDDSVALIRDAFPAATIITNQRNLGFAAAVNQGIAVARGEFVQLINPDVFLDKAFIEILAASLDTADAEYGAATGRLMRGSGAEIEPTNLVDSKGIRMTRSGRHLDIGQGLPDGEDNRGLRSSDRDGSRSWEVFGVSGAAGCYRMSFLRDIEIEGQSFDEDFHSFREDADVAWRGRIFGWRSLYVPDAQAWHVRNVTPERRRGLSPLVNMHSVKNRFLLRLKNESAWLAFRHAPFELSRDLVVLLAVLTVERNSLPALRWLWKNRHRIIKKREQIQNRRRVADREIATWFQ